ncbi:MAG: hypothetical protein H7Y07_11715 [Pyrinomonadaceae bacterium]|nr:hypothetical protein [Sphingobacteriaceae bacterium]
MKLSYLFAPTIVVLFISCGQRAGTDQNLTLAKRQIQSDTLCFERISGSQKRDTASICMIIDGDKVTGRYENIPFEKDARKGTIAGTKNDDTIIGKWVYWQEGMQDSINFAFKLQNNLLLQRETTYNEAGKEVLTATASFSLGFKKTDCNKNQ